MCFIICLSAFRDYDNRILRSHNKYINYIAYTKI